MIDGVGPGIGKSTLAENLAAAITARGLDLDLIPEEAIFNRPEFADAAVGFRTKQFDIEREALPRGYEALVRRNADLCAWVVVDWSAGSMAEDLPWARDIAVLTEHLHQVHEIVADLDPIVLILEGDLDTAFDRAIAQRGDEWLEINVALADEEGGALSIRDRAMRAQRLRDERVRQAFAKAGWAVELIDGMRSPKTVLASALRLVGLA